jgi:hypothetical protein
LTSLFGLADIITWKVRRLLVGKYSQAKNVLKSTWIGMPRWRRSVIVWEVRMLDKCTCVQGCQKNALNSRRKERKRRFTKRRIHTKIISCLLRNNPLIVFSLRIKHSFFIQKIFSRFSLSSFHGHSPSPHIRSRPRIRRRSIRVVSF